ncbi:MAG: helix-turn-helix domain-containing protein [Solirubrobacteraceae bacterium]
MRPAVDERSLRDLARALGRLAREPTRLYLTGGATAVLEGWRSSTVDVDMRLEPELDELLRELPRLKSALGVNIELASPPDFIPELPGWRERSPFVLREGNVAVHHFDPYSQALAKVERGFDQDRGDVVAMIKRGLVRRQRLQALYETIEPDLYRYPAIDAAAFRAKLDAMLADSPMRSLRLSRSSFGAAVRMLRKRRGLSEQALADSAGLEAALIDPIENGRLAVRLPTILHLAAALDVSAAELLGLAERVDDGEGDSDSGS